jgi:prepilin-type processing-associated H-X9-DG protein
MGRERVLYGVGNRADKLRSGGGWVLIKPYKPEPNFTPELWAGDKVDEIASHSTYANFWDGSRRRVENNVAFENGNPHGFWFNARVIESQMYSIKPDPEHHQSGGRNVLFLDSHGSFMQTEGILYKHLRWDGVDEVPDRNYGAMP